MVQGVSGMPRDTAAPQTAVRLIGVVFPVGFGNCIPMGFTEADWSVDLFIDLLINL